MSKTKARKAVKSAKATKPGKVRKAVKAVKAVKAKTARSVASKLPHPPAQKTTRRAARGKQAETLKPSASAAPEAAVVTKTIQWSAAELKQFRDKLQGLHDIAVDDIGFLAGGRSANSGDGVVSKMGGDGQNTEEEGTESFAQELSLMQVSNKQDMLNEIIDAFRRLDMRTYGLCEQCGELIAEARLNAQPFATMCIKCKSAAEANRPRAQGFRKSMVQLVENEPS